jgi:hypothetical protein
VAKKKSSTQLPLKLPTITVGSRVLHPPAVVPWTLITIVLPPYFRRRVLALLLEAHRLGWQVDMRLVQMFM